MIKHAVLYYPNSFMPNSSLLWVDAGKVHNVELPEPCYTFIDVYNAAIRNGLSTVWIHPNYGDILETQSNDKWDIWTSYKNRNPKNPPLYARISKKGILGKVNIAFAARGDWNWIIETPLDILATVSYLEEVLGIPVSWSIWHMSNTVIKSLDTSTLRQGWTRPASGNPFSIPFRETSSNILYIGKLAPDVAGMYLHQFDKRSSYLSACPDLYVGAGDAIHIVGMHDMDITLPGIYRVTASLAREATFTDQFIFEDAWVTSDMLQYAKYRGYSFIVHEAHVYMEKHKTLANYAEKLYASRIAFSDKSMFPHEVGRLNAERTVKKLTVMAFGNFDSDYPGTYKMPYWFNAVVNKARVIMLSNIHKVLEKSGQTPVLIYNDSVYYLSTNSNPLTAIPELLTCGLKDGRGKFRHEGTWKVTSDFIELFNDSRPGEMVKTLNDAWENKN